MSLPIKCERTFILLVWTDVIWFKSSWPSDNVRMENPRLPRAVSHRLWSAGARPMMTTMILTANMNEYRHGRGNYLRAVRHVYECAQRVRSMKNDSREKECGHLSAPNCSMKTGLSNMSIQRRFVSLLTDRLLSTIFHRYELSCVQERTVDQTIDLSGVLSFLYFVFLRSYQSCSA